MGRSGAALCQFKLEIFFGQLMLPSGLSLRADGEAWQVFCRANS